VGFRAEVQRKTSKPKRALHDIWLAETKNDAGDCVFDEVEGLLGFYLPRIESPKSRSHQSYIGRSDHRTDTVPQNF
jgi:hypothetical protein